VLKEPGTDIRQLRHRRHVRHERWLRIRILGQSGARASSTAMIALVERRVRAEDARTRSALNMPAGDLHDHRSSSPSARSARSPSNGRRPARVTNDCRSSAPSRLPDPDDESAGLLSAIGIAGMDRMVQNATCWPCPARPLETAGDNLGSLLLDKTGTTHLRKRASRRTVHPVWRPQLSAKSPSPRSSRRSPTRRPRVDPVVALAKELGYDAGGLGTAGAELIPFTAETRMSGIAIDGRRIMKARWTRSRAWRAPSRPTSTPPRRASPWPAAPPLAVVDNDEVLGIIYLKDTVKPGIRAKFEEMRRAGIPHEVMESPATTVSTAATIAAEAGVDDFVAEAKPDDKMQLIATSRRRAASSR